MPYFPKDLFEDEILLILKLEKELKSIRLRMRSEGYLLWKDYLKLG